MVVWYNNFKRGELMRRFTKILFPISVALFLCGIALGLLGRAFCTRSNDNYKEIQIITNYITSGYNS